MRNLRLDVCYDGTRYRGWQRLADTDNTIQSKLEMALSRILEEPIAVSGSGRTDAGVHAMHQIVNFHCRSLMHCDDILAQLRRHLPEDIGIYSCREAGERFHARLHAKQKTYCYRIWNSSEPCVFQRRFVTTVLEPLDVRSMQLAAAAFLGEHDFSAFTTSKGKKKSNIRCITRAEVSTDEGEIRITFTGDGFLYNMVRIMTGTLVEVGLGRRKPEEIPELFSMRREMTGRLMPPQGLCLMEVTY